MAKITRLTPKQQARFAEWREKWIAIGLSTEPADFDMATEAALKAYELCNLKRPMVVLRVGSPYAATVGGAYAWLILKSFFKAQVRAQVRAQVGDQVRAQVWDQVWAQVRDQVWDQVGDQVGAQVGDQVWDQVRAQVGDTARDGFNNYGASNLLWAGFAAWASFFRDICGWNGSSLSKFEISESLVKSCGWTWWHENVLAISDRPSVIHRDDRGRLHCENGPAIAYRDGWSVYSIHGVVVPADIIEQPNLITHQRIDSEKNAEIRRVMIDRFGMERYIRESGAQLVHSIPTDYSFVGLRDAKLYRKELDGDEPIVCLDMLNSTPEPDGTTKRYLIRIDPNAYRGRASSDCLAAMASTYRFENGSLLFAKPEDYAPMLES